MLLTLWMGALESYIEPDEPVIPVDAAPGEPTRQPPAADTSVKTDAKSDVHAERGVGLSVFSQATGSPVAGKVASAEYQREIAALKLQIEQLKDQLAKAKVATGDIGTAVLDGDSALKTVQAALAECYKQLAQNDGHPDDEERNRPLHASQKIAVERVGSMRSPQEFPPAEQSSQPTTPVPKAITDADVARAPVRNSAKFKGTIPVVVFTYNRPQALKSTIDKLLRRMPEEGFRLFISQDGNAFPEVASTIMAIMKAHPTRRIHQIVHVRDDSGATPEEVEAGWKPYYAISHHYQSSINKVFDSTPNFDRIILLEDDVEVSKDFFEYMRGTAHLFDEDESLYCVSGFNDNGKPEHVSDPAALYRSDFFPGLGWMISRKLWSELNPIWPRGFWDDWMRQPDKRKGRSCIRPEVPRSRTTCGDDGVSGGQFCAEHLAAMRVSEDYVEWTKKDLSYLKKPAYDAYLRDLIGGAKAIRTVFEVDTLPQSVKEVKISYSSNDQVVGLEEQLDIMSDFKDGVPRTAYHGVISVRFKGRRLHLVASRELYVYD
jgi:alpha-1,3-mannosyl-glycoprotein beta-1,2-N-acetylglucosaminyltransferase